MCPKGKHTIDKINSLRGKWGNKDMRLGVNFQTLLNV